MYMCSREAACGQLLALGDLMTAEDKQGKTEARHLPGMQVLQVIQHTYP